MKKLTITLPESTVERARVAAAENERQVLNLRIFNPFALESTDHLPI